MFSRVKWIKNWDVHSVSWKIYILLTQNWVHKDNNHSWGKSDTRWSISECGINTSTVWLKKMTSLQPEVCGKNHNITWCQTCKHKPTKKKSNHFIAKRYSTGVAETLPFILREIERSYTASKGFVCVLQLKIMRREDFDFAVESTCYDILAVSRDT